MSWKIISAALAVLGSLSLFWVLNELYAGTANTRGGAIIRTESPMGFWALSAINLAWIGGLFFAAAKAWRRGQRDPNF